MSRIERGKTMLIDNAPSQKDYEDLWKFLNQKLCSNGWVQDYTSSVAGINIGYYVIEGIDGAKRSQVLMGHYGLRSFPLQDRLWNKISYLKALGGGIGGVSFVSSIYCGYQNEGKNGIGKSLGEMGVSAIITKKLYPSLIRLFPFISPTVATIITGIVVVSGTRFFSEMWDTISDFTTESINNILNAFKINKNQIFNSIRSELSEWYLNTFDYIVENYLNTNIFDINFEEEWLEISSQGDTFDFYKRVYGENKIIKNLQTSFSSAEVTRSPLTLDLDGDGVETVSVNDGVYFDHDGNGFAEKSGWVSKDDAILVRDLNNNGQIDDGSELFGD